MESGKWAGAVDAVGGQTLATLLAQLQRHGTVASYGNAAGHELNTSVFPFILRGVNLIGLDSNTCPNKRRQAAWRRMASVLSSADIQEMTARTVGLDEVPEACEELLSGDIRGRVVVDLQ